MIELLHVMGDDLMVVNAARVSFAKESTEFKEQDTKLINYLAKHNHTSPFFHPQIQFRIKMPIFMAREWYRHTIGFSRNEVSRRYVDTEPEFFYPTELRSRAANKKQGSMDDVHPNNEFLIKCMHESCDKALTIYNGLLEEGVCPEQARIVLPQNMMTEFIETGSLAAYARLYNLRTSPDAQIEIQKYANVIGEHLSKKFPASWAALTSSASA